jgi:hypothetical protein
MKQNKDLSLFAQAAQMLLGARRVAMLLVTLLLTMTAHTAWAQSTMQFPIYTGDEGTSENPYQIKTTDDLNKLAADVNSGTTYADTYFKMTADLDYEPTIDWDDATSTENKYTRIGYKNTNTPSASRPFCGHFDGNSKTISGIRIYSTDEYQGLFGLIGNGAEVKNVILDNARIAGSNGIGGIVGWNEGGTIQGCQVTATVAIVGTRSDSNSKYLGGIVGRIESGTVKNCTSSVTIDAIGSKKNEYCGGIAGFNCDKMTDNFVIGANICEADDNHHGAIVGHNNSSGTTLLRNYYHACTVAGVANVFDNGSDAGNITTDDGAMPVFTLTVGSDITTTTAATITYSSTPYYVFGKAITLSGGLDNLGTFGPGYTAGYVTTSGSVSGNATDGFILTMGYGDATVSASNRYPIDWATESTGNDADHAYIIYNPEQLNLLAQRVNDGNGYAGKFFKLGANIAYAHKAANEEGADTENNYTAIGTITKPFNGCFDGDGHTISGIRIYKSGITNADDYQGLFGYVGETGVISGVIVTDAHIVGHNVLGVIAAHVLTGGRLSHNYYNNCTVGTATTGIGTSGSDITANDGAIPVFTLTVGSGITAEATPATTVSGTPYYRAGTTVTLSGQQTDPLPVGSIYSGYSVNNVPIASYIFEMPASDVNVTTTVESVYTLTLAPGITAEATPATTVSGTPYYRAGTTVTLSGRPDAEEGYVYPYTVNGNALIGNTFNMPAADVTVSLGVKTNDWLYVFDGTETDPFQIKTTTDLDLLAERVNSGTTYEGKYFKLMNDLTYTHTTAWDDAASIENNYTAIGNGTHPFEGTFDGDGHTISGIRIYKGGNTQGDQCQGLFGWIEGGGTVKNLTLADARITGYTNVGGIVGSNHGIIENCHVLSNVAIHTVQIGANNHGGIVGENWDTVSHCTSAATLSLGSGASGSFYGGIAGDSYISLSDNLAIGVTIPAGNYHGAIARGSGYGNLERNYYSGCTVGDTPTASGIGCGGLDDGNGGYITADVTAKDGAVPLDGYIVTVTGNVTADASNKVYGTSPYYKYNAGATVTLSYRDHPGYVFGGYTVKDTDNGDVTVAESSGVYTFTMPAKNVTVSTVLTPDFATYWHADADHDGSTEDKAYIITTTTGLDLLAAQVNSGNRYSDTYFKLGANIEYDTSTENNYTAIGSILSDEVNHPFEGTFDGDGHTVSGIRIYKGGSDQFSNSYQGLFGYMRQGTVKNVTLSDANITGYGNVGGIVGRQQSGTIENCLVIGTRVNRTSYNGARGAIVGYSLNLGSGSTLKYNYYSNCIMGDTPTASGIGCNGADVTENDGAVPATILSENAAVPTPLSGTVVFRRSFTAGKASTICLPFGIDATQAEAAGKFFTFVGVDNTGAEWEVIMQETAPSNLVSGALSANTPYLFKPKATGPVLFHGPANYDATDLTTTDTEGWEFTGTYTEQTWPDGQTRLYGFAAANYEKSDGSLLNDVGAFRRFDYGHIYPFRCYLMAPATLPARGMSAAGSLLPESMKVRIVSAIGTPTAIGTLDTRTGEVTFDSDAWYSLDGRKLSGEPNAKGLYIQNGKKIVVK